LKIQGVSGGIVKTSDFQIVENYSNPLPHPFDRQTLPRTLEKFIAHLMVVNPYY
jgi:hypothetical protein